MAKRAKPHPMPPAARAAHPRLAEMVKPQTPGQKAAARKAAAKKRAS